MTSKYESVRNWTYGAELELSDLNQQRGLPKGFGWDRRDVTMVNSDGIAVDPKGKLWTRGGEINTPPTSSIRDQVGLFQQVLEFHSDAVINYRSNLHLHVRVPGLKDDLKACKRISRYVHENPGYLDLIEPILRPTQEAFPNPTEFLGAVRRYNRRKVSHHTVLTDKRYQAQIAASTMDEFFAAEAPRNAKGKPMFHLAARSAVNLRQLLETDTIEFRHFPGTLNPDEFKAGLIWCRDFLFAALNGGPPPEELFKASPEKYSIAKFKKYVHWKEVLYRNTVHDGTVPKDQIAKNIEKIVSGEWSKDNLPEEPKTTARLPRDFLVHHGLDTVILPLCEVKYPKGAPKFFTYRGTSGSGKSTLMFNFLRNPEFGFKEVTSKSTGAILGYQSDKIFTFVVGKYTTPAGGCDAVKAFEIVVKRSFKYLNAGYNVMAEGLLMSGTNSVLSNVSKEFPCYAFLLSTPLQECLARVKQRRANRGEYKEMNPRNTEQKFLSVLSSTKSAAPLLTGVKICSNEQAFHDVCKMLGAPKVKFNPGIFHAPS